MNAFTHLGIAVTVQRVIEDEFSVKLDTLAFRYGSIKPDISPALIKIPHYIEDALDFIKFQIEQLIYLKTNRLPKCTREFSEKLGIITHYLADFFCYVHSAHYKGGTLGHYLYEINLSNYFKMHTKLQQNRRSPQFFQTYPDYKAICNYIDKQHAEYMKENPSYEVDKNFSQKVCITVCLSIISACMAKEMATVA